jgi:hypothetical protein
MAINPAPSSYPQIIGVAGGGLDHAGWAANSEVAKIGQAGEVRTAKLLGALAVPGGPTVIHDLMLPMASITANVDHAVVSGHNIYLIDTKVWKPGRIWTLGGKTRRGWSAFPSGDKKTMEIAQLSIAGYLRNNRVLAKLHRPLLVVWSSRQTNFPNLFWYRPAAGTAFNGERLDPRRLAKMFGSKPGSPEVIAALMPLVASSQAAAKAARSAPKVHSAPAPAAQTSHPLSDPYRSDDF